MTAAPPAREGAAVAAPTGVAADAPAGLGPAVAASAVGDAALDIASAEDAVAVDPAVDEAALLALRARLAREADRDDLLDVAYRTIDSPLGVLLLAATRRGLVRVAFASEGIDAVLDVLAARVSPRILEEPVRLDAAARELDDYLAGRRRGFDISLDLALSAGFRRGVQRELPGIPYGTTSTYSALARTVGNPGAARAVGSACATNPLPVVVPCHRVLRSDGGLGGYVGGLAAKRTLLDLEAAVSARGVDG